MDTMWCNGEGVTKRQKSCVETRRPVGKSVSRRMPEVVISGNPYDICRPFHRFGRKGVDEVEAGVEGLID